MGLVDKAKNAIIAKMKKAFKTPGRRIVISSNRDKVVSMFGMGPTQLAQKMKTALSGDWEAWGELCAAFDNYMIKDAWMRGLVEKRILKTINWPHEIKPPKGKDDDPITEEVREIIDNIDSFESTFLWELAYAWFYGRSAIELMGKYDEGKNLVTVAAGHGIPPWCLRPIRNGETIWEKGAWIHKPEYQPGEEDRWLYKPDNEDWREVPAGKLLIYEIERHGSALASGLMWPLLWTALFMNFGLKDWLSFLEVYGVPLRVGKYPPQYDMDSEEVEVLARAIIDVASNAGAMIPNDMEIEFVEAMKSSSSDAFKAIMIYLQEAAAVLVLGGTLTQTAGEKGARSLGEVHVEEIHELTSFGSKALAEAITKGLIKPMVIANHGEQESYPRFVFNTTRISDLHLWMLVDQGVSSMGLPISKKHLYDRYQIPEPEEGEEVLEGRPAAPEPNPKEGSGVRGQGSVQAAVGGAPTDPFWERYRREKMTR